MGICIQRSTWRAPLQLIDSWLPRPSGRSIEQPSRSFNAVAQRFVRAGWLGRGERPSGVSATSRLVLPVAAPVATLVHSDAHLASAPIPRAPRGSSPDSRVVLSGRLSDVCAELERLVALERGATTAHR